VATVVMTVILALIIPVLIVAYVTVTIFNAIVSAVQSFASNFFQYVERCGPEFSAMLGVEAVFIGGITVILSGIVGLPILAGLAVATVVTVANTEVIKLIVNSSPICNRP